MIIFLREFRRTKFTAIVPVFIAAPASNSIARATNYDKIEASNQNPVHHTHVFRIFILPAILAVACCHADRMEAAGGFKPIMDKTLVVWATLANLTQHGGMP